MPVHGPQCGARPLADYAVVIAKEVCYIPCVFLGLRPKFPEDLERPNAKAHVRTMRHLHHLLCARGTMFRRPSSIAKGTQDLEHVLALVRLEAPEAASLIHRFENVLRLRCGATRCSCQRIPCALHLLRRKRKAPRGNNLQAPVDGHTLVGTIWAKAEIVQVELWLRDRRLSGTVLLGRVLLGELLDGLAALVQQDAYPRAALLILLVLLALLLAELQSRWRIQGILDQGRSSGVGVLDVRGELPRGQHGWRALLLDWGLIAQELAAICDQSPLALGGVLWLCLRGRCWCCGFLLGGLGCRSLRRGRGAIGLRAGRGAQRRPGACAESVGPAPVS